MTLYVGNDSDSSYNNKRSAKSVYKLCGDITSYFLLLITFVGSRFIVGCWKDGVVWTEIGRWHHMGCIKYGHINFIQYTPSSDAKLNRMKEREKKGGKKTSEKVVNLMNVQSER